MATTLVQVRIDDELKNQATAIYDALGIDLSTAVRMFLKRSVMVNGVPFSMTLPKKDDKAEKAVKAVFDTVAEELAAGGKVQVIGFGTFEVRERAARTGRNPQNGKEITIQASKSPAFKAGKGLKEQVNAAPAKKRKK